MLLNQPPPNFFGHLTRRPLVTLAGITLFAAVIRFFRLSAPCLWGDEAEVYWRTCGTFGQLLDVLRTDGFSPLHYEMHWLIGRFFGIKPTPVVLRFVPALCGTMMVPAIYFLARQLLDRSTSLLAAAVTACSAYLLFYSRDAKMYAETWLMVTLFAGCLFWWFRSPTWTPWLCWVAAGCAGVGVHMSAAVVVGLSLLFVLTQSKVTVRRGLAWAGGVAVVMAGPVGYYVFFNTFTEKAEDDWQKSSGLAWVDIYNAKPDPNDPHRRIQKDGPELLRFTATAYSMGWEWPGQDQVDSLQISKKSFTAHRDSAIAIAVLAGLGMLPWPRRWRIRDDTAPGPRWRAMAWILCWLAVPVYVFYCMSRPGFALPSDLLNVALAKTGFVKHPGLWSTIAALLVLGPIGAGLYFGQSRTDTIRTVVSLVVAVVMVLILQVIGMVMRPMAVAAAASDHPWHDLWVPRYMGFVMPAVVIATAALLIRLPTTYLRTTAIVIVLAINLTVAGGRVFGQTEQPTDLIAADEFAAVSSTDHHILAWFTNPFGFDIPGGGNLQTESGRYYLQMLANHQPMTPKHFRLSSFDYPTSSGNPDFQIPRTVGRDNRITTIIVWDHDLDQPNGSPSKDSPPPADTLLPKLPGWKLEQDRWFYLTDFWSGRDTVRIRRRVYVKG